MSINYACDQTRNLLPEDGELFYLQSFIDVFESDSLFKLLQSEINWQEEKLKIYGKEVTVPRLVSWYGDVNARYYYSGVLHEPLPWIAPLSKLKEDVEQISGHRFNSVLLNYYRHQQDSMGWHADNEKELGRNPFIASLSLGETRLFKFSHNKSKQVINLQLENGSLLLMGGRLQHCWRHCVPKTRQEKAGRINLTFRNIIESQDV